jgi:branched-chain amino acid transport system permease protein
VITATRQVDPAAEAPRRPGRRAWRGLLVAGGVVLALAAVPELQNGLGFSAYYVVFGYTLFFWITQASSWNLFSGFSGYRVFGHGLFYGAGVYVTANLARESDPPLFLALPLGALVSAVLALAVGWIVFRRGLTHEVFALFTFALAVAMAVVVRNIESIGGGGVLLVSNLEYPEWLGSINDMLYYVALALAALTVAIAWWVRRSRLGVGLAAIRDDERVAETLGVPTFRYKLTALVLGAALAGASGALNAVAVSFIEPEAIFGIQVSVFVVLMSLIGGQRHWAGPILGAVLITAMSDRLTGLGASELSQVLMAALLVFVVIRFQGGLMERLQAAPVRGATAFVVVFAVLVGTGWAGGLIGALVFAMIAMMVVLVLPDSLVRRLSFTRKAATRA